jgi:hypothetical protein
MYLPYRSKVAGKTPEDLLGLSRTGSSWDLILNWWRGACECPGQLKSFNSASEGTRNRR